MTPQEAIAAMKKERDFMVDATQKMLVSLGTMANMEATDLKTNRASELLNVLALENLLEGVKVAVAKIGTLNHVVKLLENEVQLDTSAQSKRK